MNSTRQRGALSPEIAALVSMLAECCLDGFEAEITANSGAQAVEPESGRIKRIPDSNQSREVTA